MRARQPLIEGFKAYERATWHRHRLLHSIGPELTELVHIAANYHVVAPSLSGALERHQRDKLVNLDGQLRPLLLEWKMASHDARAADAQIAWLPADQSGPEYIVRSGGLEWEVECKRQSSMVVEQLSENEADALAAAIIGAIQSAGLMGDVSITMPASFDPSTIIDPSGVIEALGKTDLIGKIAECLPGGICVEGQLYPSNGQVIEGDKWEALARSQSREGARGYYFARNVGGLPADRITVQVVGPRRTGAALAEYLWERKFSRAAGQCSGQRAGVLVFEWDGLESPTVFAESEGIRELLGRTFNEFRNIAAIAMRCDPPPERVNGRVDFSVGAYVAKSSVTDYPQVAEMVAKSVRVPELPGSSPR